MSPPNKMMPKTVLTPWLGLGIGLIVLAGAIGFNLYLDHGNRAMREKDRLSSQARVIARNMESHLASANRMLEGVRDDLPNWKGASGPQAEMHYLKALTNATPGLRYIGVMDAEGVLLASNMPHLVGRNFAYRDYFQAVKRHPDAATLYVSQPFQSVNGPYVLNVTRMISGPRGEFAGVITATLNPEYFTTLLASVLYAPDMWAGIAHDDGLLFLMVPERKGLPGTNLAQPGSFFTRHRESGQAITVLTGTVYATQEERMLAQHTVQPAALKMDKPLLVAVSRDLDVVFQPWRREALIQVGLFALLAVVSILGLYAYQRRQHRLEQQAAAARELANRFSVALDRISAYIYMKDRQRRYVYANRPTLELFKCSEEELRGSEDSRFFPPATVAQLHDIDTRVLERGEDTTEEVVAQGEDGSRRVYWEVKTPIYDDVDKTRIWGICGISTDITERRRQEEVLQESEERFRSTFDAAAIGMALVSLEGRFLRANDALCRILGYPQAELQQKTFHDITHPDDLETSLALMRELLAGSRDSYQLEKRCLHQDGHVVWILLNGSAVRDASGKVLYFVAQIQDITERRALLDKLEFQASKDYLTGLSNRRHFLERGEAELAHVQRYGHALSLFMLDIDHFKNINDTYGHKAGDIVLQKLSQVLQDTLRNVDIIGRIGGEEFVVLLPETDLEQALEVAERLREIVAAAPVIREAGLPLHFTVSIGVVTLKQKDVNLDMLLNQADRALYEAKSTGRNRVCVAA